MIVKEKTILFETSAKLLIIASLLCVLFGNGTHLHSVFDHFLSHGHILAYVHAHAADSDHDHNYFEEFDQKDTHHHPTVTIEMEGTLTPKTVNVAFTDEDISTEAGENQSVHNIKDLSPLFLDLPPPDLLALSVQYSSFSLRGPPLG